MANRYAFVVAASENYLPGLIALLNSLEHLGNKHTLFLLSYKIPDSFFSSLSYSYDIIVVNSESDCQVTGTAIERFQLAYDIMPRYKAICLLDADMFFTSSVDLFFDIASSGFVVTGSNGMIIDFNKEYQEQYKVDLGTASFPYLKTHTTVPIFINGDNIHWFRELYETRPGFAQWDDFLYLNIIGIKLGIDKKMLCMPPYVFTGIHHWHLKPAIRIIERGGITVSGTEEQIYIVHGKWWDSAWLDGLMLPMDGYAKDQIDILEGAELSRQILIEEFGKYYNGENSMY